MCIEMIKPHRNTIGHCKINGFDTYQFRIYVFPHTDWHQYKRILTGYTHTLTRTGGHFHRKWQNDTQRACKCMSIVFARRQ